MVCPRCYPEGCHLTEEMDDELVWLPTDDCLHTDPKFKEFFDKYAASQDAFFKDYALAHKCLGSGFEIAHP